MSAPQPSPSFDLALHVVDDEPRVVDTDISRKLGYARVEKIRELIARNEEELRRYGNLPHRGVNSGGRGRPTNAYYLNEPQAVLLCLRSDAPSAPDAREVVINTFMAVRRGGLAPTSLTISGDQRQVIGGIVRSVVRSAIHEMAGDLLPDMVSAHLAKQNVLVRHGKTAGQIWDRHGLPKLKSAAKWLGNRLQELGCQIEGRGERGAITVRLFDPDKAEIAFRNGLLLRARQYVAERQGQGRLRLVPPA